MVECIVNYGEIGFKIVFSDDEKNIKDTEWFIYAQYV